MATEQRRQSWTRLGVKAMDPERALNILEELLTSDAVLTTVADVKWTRFRPVYEMKGRRPLLAALEGGAPPAPSAAEDTPAEPPAAVKAEILQLPREQQRDRLLEVLRDAAARVLGVEAGPAIDPDRGLFSMGFDSVTAVELAALLSRLFERTYSATMVLDHPNLKQIRDFILQYCFGWKSREPAAGDAPGGDDLDALLAFVESVDEDEAARLLALDQPVRAEPARPDPRHAR
jgi:microcystin synthetase protein McyG